MKVSCYTVLSLAHSPDPDDAFMFFGIKKSSDAIKFRHILKDIQSLNEDAARARFDVSAISLFAYAFCWRHYQILRCGASAGIKYGPVLVSKRKINIKSLPDITVAVPGQMTTSYAVLKIICPGIRTVVYRFDKIADAVINGEADAGLLIHGGQLTYKNMGLHKILDLGKWWWQKFSLPLPLGVVVVRRKFPWRLKKRIAEIIQNSIRYAYKNKQEALDLASKYACNMCQRDLERFINMYVNKLTYRMDKNEIRAINILFDRALEIGLISEKVVAEFIP